MRRFWMLLFMFWPFLAATVLVIAADNGHSDYWLAAPWYMILGAIVSLPTAGLTTVAMKLMRPPRSSYAAGVAVYLGGLAVIGLWLSRVFH